MTKLTSILLALTMWFSSVSAYAQDYVPYRLPKPEFLTVDAEEYAGYDKEGFKSLLRMDQDFRTTASDLELNLRRVEELNGIVSAERRKSVKYSEQLQLCLVDRTRITEKWKKTEERANIAESKEGGRLSAVVGWSVAGVSLAALGGLIIGLIVK